MNERIKQIRKSRGLKQREFGNRIGITTGSISNIEKGKRSPSEQTIMAICKEYKVNINWLKTGVGDMFLTDETEVVKQLVQKYSLSDFEESMLQIYIALPKDTRDSIMQFLQNISNIGISSILPQLD
ncbi:MAG: helix-turn-helix domain-containing protein [Turicibacter sp.]|nr:helix-turn-helix domain-containing protein [Turicibacter sp.]